MLGSTRPQKSLYTLLYSSVFLGAAKFSRKLCPIHPAENNTIEGEVYKFWENYD